MAPEPPLLEVERLCVAFPLPGWRRTLRAVDDVSFTVAAGESVGLIGESGSGKSTIARVILNLQRPSAGRVLYRGGEVSGLSNAGFRPLRPRLQMVFQDPWASLSRRMTIGALIEEPLLLAGALDRKARRDRVRELLAQVDLDPAVERRYPPGLSGGQLQRVCIARAIATMPDLLVLDEPTSSLDLSVRASIVALLRRIQTQSGMAMLFISHDILTVRRLASRAIVLNGGRVMEQGSVEKVIGQPSHPYTQALLSAYLPPPGRRTDPRR
jgi:ABC-type glutathione transport system ATPase component